MGRKWGVGNSDSGSRFGGAAEGDGYVQKSKARETLARVSSG